MVMVSNRQGNIIYVNPALDRMLKTYELDIREQVSSFDASNLIGAKLGAVHGSLSQGSETVEVQSTAQEISVVMGSRHLNLTISPVTNASGAFLGTIVEWMDRTVELAMQGEIDRIINAAREGNLREKIDLHGVDGAYLELAAGMNELTRVVTHATDELAAMLAAMAEGDLDRRIEGDFKGQFGDLKDHANNMASQLATIVGEVKTAAGQISSTASMMSSGTMDLSNRTEQAASNLEETAAATEQVSATVKHNAENAKDADKLADAANNTASTGGMVVEKAIEAMSCIDNSAQKITDIIGVIDEIAFQTNLLALNASVEAARAGAAGKGFAVVAQEVRQLAQRSAQAATDIKILIQNSNEQVKDGVQLVNQAGGALGEIVNSIGKVSGIVREISSASQEQAIGVQEISNSITNMDEMTQQNSALVEESTAGARDLSDQANKLGELMAFFQIDAAAGSIAPPRITAKPASLSPKIKPSAKSQPVATTVGDDDWSEF